MKNILFIIVFIIIYIVNFVQLIVALSTEDWGIALAKLVGVLTVVGSIITVWF